MRPRSPASVACPMPPRLDANYEEPRTGLRADAGDIVIDVNSREELHLRIQGHATEFLRARAPYRLLRLDLSPCAALKTLPVSSQTEFPACEVLFPTVIVTVVTTFEDALRVRAASFSVNTVEYGTLVRPRDALDDAAHSPGRAGRRPGPHALLAHARRRPLRRQAIKLGEIRAAPSTRPEFTRRVRIRGRLQHVPLRRKW